MNLIIDTDSSQHGLTSACRQMTIFYGGQAHVFDDVHPHKVWPLLVSMTYLFIAFSEITTTTTTTTTTMTIALSH